MNTIGDIVTAASILLRDQNFEHFSADIMYSFANAGSREIARRTHCLKIETGTLVNNLVADVQKQSLNSLIYDTTVGDIVTLGIFDVSVGNTTDGTLKTIPYKSMADLNRDRPSWRNWDSGTPRYWCDAPDNSIYLMPAPSSTFISEEGLYIVYSRLPINTFSSSDPNDVPEISEKAWDALVTYITMMGKSEDREFSSFDRLFQVWQSSLQYIKSEPYVIVRGRVGSLIPSPDIVGVHY
jgi:hypothetical protein